MMKSKAWLRYVVPMGFTWRSAGADEREFVVDVSGEVVAVAAALVYFRKEYEELRRAFPCWRSSSGLWPLRSGFVLIRSIRSTAAGRRSIQRQSIAGATEYVPRVSRCRAVIVVPAMEELFWRAFLIRWLVKEDFKSVPVGTFTGFHSR